MVLDSQEQWSLEGSAERGLLHAPIPCAVTGASSAPGLSDKNLFLLSPWSPTAMELEGKVTNDSLCFSESWCPIFLISAHFLFPVLEGPVMKAPESLVISWHNLGWFSAFSQLYHFGGCISRHDTLLAESLLSWVCSLLITIAHVLSSFQDVMAAFSPHPRGFTSLKNNPWLIVVRFPQE